MGEREGFEGVRLLEVGSSLGVAWVGKLFADLGADVVRLEEADDRVRARPHEVHRWLNAGKRSMTGGFGSLVPDADIVIHGFGPSAANERGLDYRTLAAAGSPALVVCSVTPFGMTGPYSDYAAEELNIIHGSSWGFLSPSAASDPELPPLKAPGHHATITVSTVAATATLAAFDRAQRTGRGEYVDFALFAAAAKLTETAPAAASFLGEDASRLGVKTVVPWEIYECIGGLVQCVCVEQAQWDALVELMGNPDWAELDIFATNVDRQENADLVDLYLREWMATQQADEVYHRGQAARICVSPVNTMAQLDVDPHLEARGFFHRTPDGLRVPGPGFQLDRPWWALRAAAPELGEHDGEGRPLEGVRVCDFTWVWAGPFCTQYLAHLGADVVRLESPEHLCLFRRLPFNPPGTDLGPNTTGQFQLYNSDKRSLGIDLRNEAAREVIRRLVACSDVVIDNFGVGVMASLGLGPEDLRAINPDVIVTSLSGYGQTGPNASYMAYGPVGGAVSGLYAANGYEGGLPRETGVAVGDPGTGITAAWAIVAALAARRRTGEAARVDVAMVEAVASTLGEVWMEYLATGEPPGPRGNHDVSWAPHGCYPAAGEDRWVTIACPDDESWQSLCSVLDPALLGDPRFADVALRKRNEAELDEIVAAWTATRDRWETTGILQAAGVAAFPSVSPLELWGGDPQLEERGMLERPVHPVTGAHVVPGIPWRLAAGPDGIRRPAPKLGEHTREVLVEVLGYSPGEVEELFGADAVFES